MRIRRIVVRNDLMIHDLVVRIATGFLSPEVADSAY